MSSTNFQKILFINASQRPGPGSFEKQQRRIASSHAARTAHARVRHRQTKEFQAAKALQLRENKRSSKENAAPTPTLWVEAPSANIKSAGFLPNPFSLPATNYNIRHETFPALVKAPLGNFLLHHYVKWVIPFLITHCEKLSEQVEYAERMSTEWVRLALTTPGFFSGILLIASRHLSMIYDSNQEMKHKFTKHAMHYKVACVQSLGTSITAEQSSAFTDSTLAQVMTLALDELVLGDFAMAKNHMQGAARMVVVNGGPGTLGLDGFLELLFRKYVDEVDLLSGATDRVPPASCAEALMAHPVSSYV